MLSVPPSHPAARLRESMARKEIQPFIGIYDAFSATLAARHFDTLFVSGFGFAASHHGLPDIGFINWSDLVDFVHRLRLILPRTQLLVDIDDGYGDPEVACHVTRQLDGLGVSAIVLEDQRRPRRCGHLDGKQVLTLEEYLPKLRAVLAARRNLLVVARTDASDPDDIRRRIDAFAEAGADIVLADGIQSLDLLEDIARSCRRPLAFNQMAGGKSPNCSLPELAARGVSLVIYSTPCLFAAQAAIDRSLTTLAANLGNLKSLSPQDAVLTTCNAVLQENLKRTQE